MRAILDQVAAELGVSARQAELLRLHSNAVFALPRAGLVIRVATAPDALARIAMSVRVTGWLASRGFPCVRPAPIPGQPLIRGGRPVTIWRHVSVVAEPAPTGAELGGLLRDLHACPEPPLALARLADPLGDVSAAVARAAHTVTAADRAWLGRRIAELRAAWQDLGFTLPAALIHGDAHPNNLMRAVDGRVVLGDWDHVGWGPPEWDLTQVHYTHRRFGRPARADLDGFARAYGWDIRDWPGLAVVVAIREISGLTAYLRHAPTLPTARAEVARRLADLRAGRETARWDLPSR